MENLDIRRIKLLINDHSHELAKLKELFRESGQPRISSTTYASRAWLKQEVTVLCSIRAHHRGKIHLNQHLKTLEEQAKFIGDRWKDYERQVLAVA